MNSEQAFSAIPLYKKIYLDLKQQITNGSLKPQQKLPSEHFLCQNYQVSRITVRKALKLLGDEKLIVSVQGKGSYVSSTKMTGKLNRVQGFSEFAVSRDKASKQTILKREILKNPAIAKALLLPEQADLIYIKRLFQVDEVSIAIDEAWLSAKHYPDLLVNINEQTPLYEYLENKYHEIATSSHREINSVLPSSTQKELLSLTKTVPLFEVEKLAYDQFKQPLEYSHYVVRGDKMTYTIDSTSDSHIHLNDK
ncbi:GntR family transcriptional regulator [Lactobacillus sp. ESL0684]|uniref:GntR family transcriptional regulator n=1 Tax=Lactobacillus sp. ESL0684 TaxID=2983213 RepID=UPI0023F86086|nr:GntR family transcriptional regulator [Lactobacillus sp. ESL0684]WEV43210.1 GntR family transcriptional regulator [Lactobacillus sp. ESL0684]